MTRDAAFIRTRAKGHVVRGTYYSTRPRYSGKLIGVARLALLHSDINPENAISTKTKNGTALNNIIYKKNKVYIQTATVVNVGEKAN